MNAETAAMFARVRANADEACFEAGDLFEIMQVIAVAERAAVGDGVQYNPVWFTAMLARNGIQLPLRVLGDGDIEDAVGSAVLQIDPNCERPDDQVAELADVVVLALNACAGFAPCAITSDILPVSTSLEVAA